MKILIINIILGEIVAYFFSSENGKLLTLLMFSTSFFSKSGNLICAFYYTIQIKCPFLLISTLS